MTDCPDQAALTPADEAPQPGRRRTLYLAFAAMALAYLPWYNYSAVLPLVREEFGLTSADAGIILGIFQLGYVIFVLFSGWLSDRVSPTYVLAGSALLTGVSSIAFALFAHDFYTTLVLRILVGMGCGGLYVPGMALLSEWFPVRERGMAIGTYSAAVTLGYAGAYLLAGPLGGALGWRTAVMLTSLGCFLSAWLYLSGVKRPPCSLTRSRVQADTGQAWRTLMRSRVGLVIVLLTVAYGAHMWEA